MIEILETPTFVVDDFFDAKYIKLFDYLDFEAIDFEVLELCSAEIPHRNTLYYPVIVKEINDDTNYINMVNPRALQMAKDEAMVIVFIYEGIIDVISTIRLNLLNQLTQADVPLQLIRFITPIKPAEIIPPFIFYPFAEMDEYIKAKKNDKYYGINEHPRKKLFSMNITEDTPHARVLGASIWYHALHHNAFFNYPERSTGDSVVRSNTYKWSKKWTETATLMDMFGQQLPSVTHQDNENDQFDQAYWNFVVAPQFPITTLAAIPEMFAPMLNYQPFVNVGPPGTLKMLRSLGYKTFKSYVNEEYDRVVGDEERMYSLFRLIYELAYSFNDKNLMKLNEKIIPILKHNHNHFLAPKRHRLIGLLEHLKYPKS